MSGRKEEYQDMVEKNVGLQCLSTISAGMLVGMLSSTKETIIVVNSLMLVHIMTLFLLCRSEVRTAMLLYSSTTLLVGLLVLMVKEIMTLVN